MSVSPSRGFRFLVRAATAFAAMFPLFTSPPARAEQQQPPRATQQAPSSIRIVHAGATVELSLEAAGVHIVADTAGVHIDGTSAGVAGNAAGVHIDGVSTDAAVAAAGVHIDGTPAGVHIDGTPAGVHIDREVRSVVWDPARFATACDALGEGLALIPPFEGDLDLDGDALEVLPPLPGEGVDCAALALLVERSLATGGPWTFDAPLTLREPTVTTAEIEAIARDVRPLLEADVTLDVTFEGARAGSLTLSPDDVRAALHLDRSADSPHPVATLRTQPLQNKLIPLLTPLGELARDAELTVDARGSVHVVPATSGIRIDGANLFAAASDAAKKPDKKATVTAAKGAPALTTKKAENLSIKNLVSSFTTKYPCCQPRVTNIHKIATLLDGAIVKAGERFSVNQHVGKRTTKKGFVLAPSIGEGEIVETVGGGVSQVATTMYNAVFDGGYAVVSRKPHTRYFDRYPLGVEATLSWPRPDFVFRNDSKSGVLIKASFTDDSITIKLYGDNEGRKVKRFTSKTFASTDPRIDYVPDDTLPLDKPKTKDPGTRGFSVKAGRDITFADGTKKHEERTVIYHGKPRILAAHPCAIPKGEPGHRKKGCPKPDDTAAATTSAASTKTDPKKDSADRTDKVEKADKKADPKKDAAPQPDAKKSTDATEPKKDAAPQPDAKKDATSAKPDATKDALDKPAASKPDASPDKTPPP